MGILLVAKAICAPLKPAWFTCSFARKARMACTDSLTRVRGLSQSMPIFSKVALSPGPMPRMARPPDSSFMEAMDEAVMAAFLV